ncbi:MAG: NAD-dependent epimerase/dehydratase family protein [Bacilli bacterium]|jgi:nucleoside-diphosphate-sugar epimerase
MNSLYQSGKYLEEVKSFSQKLDLTFLRNKSILISGATGMIASLFIDAILFNREFPIEIQAITRNKKNFYQRFSIYQNDQRLQPFVADVKEPLNLSGVFDYVIHAASYTDPKNYATYPIDTILVNILGTKNLLDITAKNKATFMLLSTCEIYGEGSKELLAEEDYGYLDPLVVRNGYNESKRASESLTIAYSYEKDIKVLLPRLSRTFGPTMHLTDSKAISQFMKRAVWGENIILKSRGLQKYSYLYVFDAVSAIFHLLEKGENRVAYNVAYADEVTLKEMAEKIANIENVQVEMIIEDEFAGRGYSLATKALQDTTRLLNSGWKPLYTLDSGLEKTMKILKERIEQ